MSKPPGSRAPNPEITALGGLTNDRLTGALMGVDLGVDAVISHEVVDPK